MQNFYDYKKYAILYVDDEEKSLKYLSRAFADQFRILTAKNAAEGYAILEEQGDEIAMLMTDQRMPGEKGVQLLERARALRPRIIRILATAYSDMDAAIDAVNTGAIYKYVAKPWDMPDLETTLKRGLEFFMVQTERDQLMHEKLSVIHNMMIKDRVLSLGVVAGGLGHYVRNSLVAVRTFLDLAPSKLQEENLQMAELRNPNFWKDFYDHVQSQVKRISALLGDLSDADQSPDEFNDSIKLGEFIGEILEKIAPALEEKHLAVKNAIPTDLPPMQVNAHKFGRMLELLVRDEVANLTDGDEIAISAEVVPATDEDTEAIRLLVKDNGHSLPEEDLRQVFDPFFVRNGDPKEFGINLMTCYFIVHHHGGKIDVRTEAGAGTVFDLKFPVAQPSAAEMSGGEDFVSKVLTNEVLWERLLAGH